MTDKPKPKPFRGRTSTCTACGAKFVYARTVATDRGRGGSWMPIDVVPNPEGRFAIRDAGSGVLYARPLAKDEGPDLHNEVLGMPHQATCGTQLVSEIEKYLQQQAEGGAQ